MPGREIILCNQAEPSQLSSRFLAQASLVHSVPILLFTPCLEERKSKEKSIISALCKHSLSSSQARQCCPSP